MKTIIYTDLAPQPIGPYNQAVFYKNNYEATLYTSGQIAIDPKSGELKINNLIEETHLVMQHLNSLLSQVGMTFEHVLKTTIFLSDMGNFATVNEVYGSYFNESTAPARETVEVANLPKYVNVEISLIAKLEL
ncbi:reactive intermediate/imine deaminase [Nonlabens dokdonensis]|uniref:Reactive intermediate/imine deaminase n=1 Tax=Nonlabens dokdonensis TaxID=328515 RepID=A0A1Z8AX50_9FLAO|nr:Rid family detoxifying hydrolase [Nonlabens dokdonensis]OUS14903.1 reactive intermediate/imine deaminase [Nonlabens dokdonensis]